MNLKIEKKRKCKKCGKVQDIEQFQKYYDKKGGQYYRLHQCKTCLRDYQKKYRQRNMRNLFLGRRVLGYETENGLVLTQEGVAFFKANIKVMKKEIRKK